MFRWFRKNIESVQARFSARMVEPIRFETTTDQQMALLRAIGETGREKAPIIRAAIALALPALVANPEMIDRLQPGKIQGHNGCDD